MVRRFWRRAAVATATVSISSPMALATQEVELVAHTEDAEVRGYVRLPGIRLTDLLNSGAPITIQSGLVVPLGSDSSHYIHDLVASRPMSCSSCAQAALAATRAAGIGPGRYRSNFAATPTAFTAICAHHRRSNALDQLGRRPSFVPLTDAHLEYRKDHGLRRRAATLIVNCHYLEEAHATIDEEVLCPDLDMPFAKRTRAKDFTEFVPG